MARPRARTSRRSLKRKLFSLSSHVFVYYVMYLSLWACPFWSHNSQSLDLDDPSCPRLCKPLHHVFDLAQPHAQPVYDSHIAPVIAKVSPYVDIVTPYVRKSAIVASRLSDKGKASYTRVASPVVEKLQKRADSLVAPYRSRAVDWYTAHVAPYTTKLCTYTTLAWDRTLSVYSRVSDMSRPHLTKAYYQTKPYVVRASNCVYKYSRRFLCAMYEWSQRVVMPQIRNLYHNTVEPQVSKVYARVFDNSGHVVSVDANPTSVYTPVETAANPVEESMPNFEPEPELEPQSEQAPETFAESSTIIEAQEDLGVMGTGLPEDPQVDTLSDESVPTTPEPSVIEITVTQTQAEKPSELSSSQQLQQWNEIVRTTTREAFAAFLDDIEQEKLDFMDRERPVFTDLLRSLQSTQKNTIIKLSDLISRMEKDDEDESIDVGIVQEAFRQSAEDIRNAAMAVREQAQQFATSIIDRIEELRTLTLDVLDEFADVTLQEIGRNMVSVSASGPSASSEANNSPNWKDWRAFRQLKDRLIQSRQDIVDYEANIADVNQMLREAQETANVLAREAAQYMSGLRSKADHIFIQRANKAAEPASEPTDAEFYDASEEKDDIAEFQAAQVSTSREEVARDQSNLVDQTLAESPEQQVLAQDPIVIESVTSPIETAVSTHTASEPTSEPSIKATDIDDEDEDEEEDTEDLEESESDDFE